MAPANKNSGLSAYEQQRQNNLEENRKILESIRQEQLYSLSELYQVQQAASKTKKTATAETKPKNNKRNKTPKQNVVPDEATDEGQSDAENVSGRRKSARLTGKKPKFSFRNPGNADSENSGEEDFNVADYDCSEDEDFEKPKRKAQPNKGPKQKIIIPKNRENFYGSVAGVEIGRIWETRMACCADGVHRPTVAGIHAGPEGAYSISLSGGYEDDVDLGDCFTYTGEGGRELKGTTAKPKNLRTAPQSKDQQLTRGNLALSLNVTSRRPIRVIRGSKLKNKMAPEYGYRYDGLYTVEKYWLCVGKSGHKVYKFGLIRCPDQAPPPWVSGVVSYANAASSAEQDDDEDAVKQPEVLQVKLFNKKT